MGNRDEKLADSRGDALAELQQGMRLACGAFNAAWEFELENGEHGYRLSVADRRSVQSLIARFQRELQAAIAAPRLEPVVVTAGLQLVVDNTR